MRLAKQEKTGTSLLEPRTPWFLKTQQIILMGLGRSDRIHVHIYRDGEFDYLDYDEVEEFVNDDFETISG